MTINGNIITPAEGKYLTNVTVYSDQVYLGIHDSPENWYEVDEIPEQQEFDESELPEAARILLGVSE